RLRRDAAAGRAVNDRAARHRGRAGAAPGGRRARGGCRMIEAPTASTVERRSADLARAEAGEHRGLRVAVVNGSPSEKSKTMGLVDAVLQTLRDVLGRRLVDVADARVDVYRLGPAFTGAVEREGIDPAVEAALREVEHAD